MKIIEVKNLTTAFGDNLVHNNISFDVNQGEIFGVLGGSGSGKSVLVKQIVMLNQIQKGTIKIFDRDISKLSLQEIQELKLQYSYLFQFGALYSFLDVIENISVMLKEYTNLPKDLIEKIAYTNLDIVGLQKSTAKHYPKYIEIVCDHFRYSYNYGGNEADMYATSKLLTMSEGYHQKQFVRNLIRKLPKISDFDISKLNSFLNELLENQEKIHSIILSFYKNEIERNINTNNYHKLQIKVLEKNLQKLPINNDFDFSASDRDANLDIPYMD